MSIFSLFLIDLLDEVLWELEDDQLSFPFNIFYRDQDQSDLYQLYHLQLYIDWLLEQLLLFILKNLTDIL